ncbi:MAG: Asp-tRNA(Asn)/Glu-tRNA(Gln) amidotransferase subunit GatA [TACK group archaeon]|nr:Asp-tRNA(Asn)/Glu-tRNA(Gln) amidotransferase subunit GatA [TACK group archaeon]
MEAFSIADKVRRGELSAQEVTGKYIDLISRWEPKIHAFLYVDEKGALERARQIDDLVKKGVDPGRLAGVPVAVKDNIAVKGMPLTCASKILSGYVSPYDATVVSKLRQAGSIIVGKTNLDEFAMGSSTEYSAFGPTRNPWDLERVPGGSSGGSGAAVASGEVPIALGSDTGGSVRCPASFTGVYGLKPTYGLVSRYGLVAFSNSIEVIGGFSTTAKDMELLFSVIRNSDAPDPMDQTSVFSDPTSFPGLRGMRVGLLKETVGEGAEPEVVKATYAFAEALREAGALVDEVSIPDLSLALPAYYLLTSAEASSNLARYDGIRYGMPCPLDAKDWNEAYSKVRGEGFGPEVKRRIMMGSFALSSGYYDAYYLKAVAARSKIRQEMLKVLNDFQFLIGPTNPTTAPKLGERITDPLSMYLLDLDTVPVNLAGIPALSIPFGKSSSGMPIGVQLMSSPLRDDWVIKAAEELEAMGRVEMASKVATVE